MYQSTLWNDQIKFLALTLTANEEKNKGKKYVGQIDFDSPVLAELANIFRGKDKSKKEVAKQEGKSRGQDKAKTVNFEDTI